MSDGETIARRVEALSTRLEAFEARGGARFDRPGCRCVRALLERAESAASPRTLARAEARLNATEARFARVREQCESAIDELACTGSADTTRLRADLTRGDLTSARRGVRRIRALSPLALKAGAFDRESGERYRRAVAEFSAAVTIARARANLPAEAGPYNSTLIATHTLDRLASTSPTYLRTLVERLEELASLQELAPAPEPAPKTKSSRTRSGGGGARNAAKAKPRRRRKSARAK